MFAPSEPTSGETGGRVPQTLPKLGSRESSPATVDIDGKSTSNLNLGLPKQASAMQFLIYRRVCAWVYLPATSVIRSVFCNRSLLRAKCLGVDLSDWQF